MLFSATPVERHAKETKDHERNLARDGGGSSAEELFSPTASREFFSPPQFLRNSSENLDRRSNEKHSQTLFIILALAF